MHGAPGDGKQVIQRPARQFAVGLEQQRGKQSFGFVYLLTSPASS
jgi:hypothetical protein